MREFAEREVAPEAERIHRRDELVPEAFITKMAELGYFGLAVPEAYGGSELGNLAMILTTEELSRASLAAAGSLVRATTPPDAFPYREELAPRRTSARSMLAKSILVS